ARHMEEAAPHVDLTLGADCPECAREFTVPFDLVGFLLGECHTSRALLYREVHYLAYHYHWSEHDIMALPREKRRTYIALLAEDLGRVAHAVGPTPSEPYKSRALRVLGAGPAHRPHRWCAGIVGVAPAGPRRSVHRAGHGATTRLSRWTAAVAGD